tara:strand:- start:151 stop:1251 length:1101 start_codon:yes stop_codon:yes gene_type:complete
MNNNDILKNAIREFKAKGETFFTSFSGKEIGDASRTTLDQWLGDAGYDSRNILAEYHAKEELAPVVHAAPAAPAAPAGDDARMQALQVLLGGGQQIDVAKLKAELKEELKKEMGLQPIQVEVIQPDKPKQDCGMQHYLFPDLLTLVSCRIHVFLSGPAGSFKTTAAEQVAKALELEYSAISVCGQTGAHSLLGYQDAQGHYVTTEFRKRYEQGGIFLLDEIDNGNANVLAVLNSALANGTCAFPDGMIKKHEDFILIASGNTAGTGADAKYIGRNPIDGATLDRFAFMKWGYDEALEKAIGSNAPWTLEVQAMRATAEKNGSKAIISPRATFSGAKLIAAGMSTEKVRSYLIKKGMSEIEWKKTTA